MQNYKVFINSDLIFFEQNANLKSFLDLNSEYQKITEQELPFLIEKIQSGNFSGKKICFCENPKEVFDQFKNSFKVLEAAGGLVQNQRNDLLMIHRFEKWDFPKGHVEKNEAVYEAAIREVTEETGAKNLKITEKLPCTYHMYDNHGKMVIKRTYWYLMKTDFKESLKPQMEEDILAAIWVPSYAIEEYIQKSYPALKELVKAMIDRNILKL